MSRAPVARTLADNLVTAPVHVDMVQEYRKLSARRGILVCLATIALVLFAGWVSIRGIAETSLGALFSVLSEQVSFGLFESEVSERTEQILLQLRLPRVLLGILAGAGLSLSGVLMQAITRNPLVSPYTIGVSSAAAFGASLAIMFGSGIGILSAYLVPAAAFLFALVCAVLVFSLSWLRSMGATSMVLIGIALMYLFSAMTASIQFIATEEQLARVVHWTFGSLNGAVWREVMVVGLVFALVLPLVVRNAWSLNVLTSGGDEVAQSMGVSVRRLRILSMIAAVMLAAVVISFTGVIGFVGLIGPHVARLIIGADHRMLIPFSMICGGALLLAADTVGRLAFTPIIIPVGIVVAFMGVPLFLHLVLARRREYFA